MVNEELVGSGIIFGSLQKNSASSSQRSQSFLSFPVLALCSVTFLYLSSNFFHLFAHCSPVTLTDELALNCSATLSHATFFLLCLCQRGWCFSCSREINSFVLCVVHITSFSVFSRSILWIYWPCQEFSST